MEKFWKLVITTSGLGGVGAFIFWSLYKEWLTLSIFSALSSTHTFIIMLIFLGLTFLSLIAILITYIHLKTPTLPPKIVPQKKSNELINKENAENKAIEYFCYISREKVDQLFADFENKNIEEIDTYSFHQVQNIISSDISYGRPDFLLPERELRISYVKKLKVILQHISKNIIDFDWFKNNEINKSSFYWLKNKFIFMGFDEKHSMVELRTKNHDSSLTLHCSIKYFSHLTAKDRKLTFHSTNYAFFEKKITIEFETIFILLSESDGEFYGSPLFLRLSSDSMMSI